MDIVPGEMIYVYIMNLIAKLINLPNFAIVVSASNTRERVIDAQK